MRCEIPHRCVRRKYRIRRHSPFRLRNCWEGRSVRASSLLRQLAKGGCAARRLSWVTPGFSQSRRCKTTASAKLACLQVDDLILNILSLLISQMFVKCNRLGAFALRFNHRERNAPAALRGINSPLNRCLHCGYFAYRRLHADETLRPER